MWACDYMKKFQKSISNISDTWCQLFFSSQISSLSTAADNKTLAIIQNFWNFCLKFLFSLSDTKRFWKSWKDGIGERHSKAKASDDLVSSIMVFHLYSEVVHVTERDDKVSLYDVLPKNYFMMMPWSLSWWTVRSWLYL